MAVIRRQHPPMAGPDILILEKNTGRGTEMGVGARTEIDTGMDVAATDVEIDTETDAETVDRLAA